MPQLQTFQCPACGANLTFNGGQELTFRCQFCGTSIGVPEELRQRTMPTQAAQPAAGEAYQPDNPLGEPLVTGLALNIVVVDWLLTQADEQTGERTINQPTAYERITKAAEKAMRELKTEQATTISLPYFSANQNGPIHFQTQLTRVIVDKLARNAPGIGTMLAVKKKGLFGR